MLKQKRQKPSVYSEIHFINPNVKVNSVLSSVLMYNYIGKTNCWISWDAGRNWIQNWKEPLLTSSHKPTFHTTVFTRNLMHLKTSKVVCYFYQEAATKFILMLEVSNFQHKLIHRLLILICSHADIIIQAWTAFPHSMVLASVKHLHNFTKTCELS